MSHQVFNKGSIVPRRLGLLLATKKKAQHWLVFGVNVVWDGKTLKTVAALAPGDSLVKVAHGMSSPRKNKTRQKSGFSIGSNWTAFTLRDSELAVAKAWAVRVGGVQ